MDVRVGFNGIIFNTGYSSGGQMNIRSQPKTTGGYIIATLVTS